MHKIILLILSILFLLQSCLEVTRPFSQLPPGIWRAELELSEDVILPFNFETRYNEQGELEIDVINSTERIQVKDISFGTTRELKDTVVITFPLMDSYISAQYKENVIEGVWHVNYRENYEIPFVAFYGQSHRFTTEREEVNYDLTGRWQATFEVETEDAYPAIGEFVQNGNHLTGTFMTETGDYRYLEGTVQGDEFALSCFEGGHAFLFKGHISKDETLTGTFYSGSHYKTNWVAARNNEAQLTDAYQLSRITTPDKKIDFSLPNTEGKIVSLGDNQYSGKAKLITIMGTWCPNCLDESKFLLNYLENNPDQEIEIIALAFEKYRDEEKATEIIRNYKERLKIPYEILLAGYFDKDEATKNLGFIDKILSYPTLLFVDKNNEVKKVHTGFTGPATSEFRNFASSFEREIENLLQ